MEPVKDALGLLIFLTGFHFKEWVKRFSSTCSDGAVRQHGVAWAVSLRLVCSELLVRPEYPLQGPGGSDPDDNTQSSSLKSASDDVRSSQSHGQDILFWLIRLFSPQMDFAMDFSVMK